MPSARVSDDARRARDKTSRGWIILEASTAGRDAMARDAARAAVDARDAWAGCGHRHRTKRVRVRERAADGSESHKVHELRIGMKDVEPNDDGDEDEDVEVDPFFFDDGYDVAASTGFTRVWEGAEALTAHLERTGLGRGERVLELGAGVGECGLACAALGAHVLLTDVRAVCENVIRRNIEQNGTGPATELLGAWPNAARIGSGSASRATLNWMDEIPSDPFQDSALTFRDADILIAAECVWLRELLLPFVTTSSTLLRGGVRELILSVRDRSSTDDASSGKAFPHTNEVVREFESTGCSVEALHRQRSEDEGKEIVIFRITSAAAAPGA